ncbi:uncharacterized protein LOC141598792 [Silene latifolia]|uniref:uncharacterized protein LOC141598792 n=1 Tax=Silene latifolia TaxID=37657 RepID=UPI003D770A63
MTSPTSSSSPSSETTGKPHPYQTERLTGSPKGAFEARKVRTGLYIRVDMPGVPNDVVKIVKYEETCTVTFSAKAPPCWTGFDSPDDVRIYAGYVVIDRHLADVDFVHYLKNGCLRLFFPGCDGSLHFLSPKGGSVDRDTTSVEPGEDEEEKVDVDPFIAFISHDPNNPQGIVLGGGSSEHINPYLLSGVKGVYEHKIVTLDSGEQLIYVRLDVPDTCLKSTGVIENFSNAILLGALAFKKEYYSRFDEAPREYQGVLASTCQCCKYSVVKYENTNGVLRVLLRKSGNVNPDPRPIIHCSVPPKKHGRRLHHPALNLLGAPPPTSRFHPRNRGTPNPSRASRPVSIQEQYLLGL